MTTKKFSVTAQQRRNLEEAFHVMWPSVPPKNVAPGLWAFRIPDDSGQCASFATCGTIACFGGWCPWWGPFAAQGVIVDPDSGVPGLVQDVKDRLRAHYSPFRHLTNSLVALHLFGFPDLFFAQGEFLEFSGIKDYNKRNCSAHAAVTRRLKWLIKNSQVINNGKEWA